MNQRGFTLTELLIACAVMGVIMAGLLTLLMTGQRSYAVGTNQAEAQQNLRLAMSRMLREIREAGYDPLVTATFAPIINQSVTALTIQNDWDGSETITTGATVAPPWGGGNRGEQITYSVGGNALLRQETGVDATAQPIVEGIRSLSFEYQDAAGGPPLTAADIRTVIITVTTGPADQPGSGAAGDIQVTMTDRVRLRNRGI